MRDGVVVALENGRDRAAVIDQVISCAREEPRTVVGLDFAFSLPAWHLRERGFASAPALWACATDKAARGDPGWPRALPEPHWGPRVRRMPDVLRGPEGRLRRFRVTDREESTSGARPMSPLQLSGPGSVGAQALHGMAQLPRLRAAGLAVWPFEEPRLPMVVEVFPRLLAHGLGGAPVRRLRGAAFRAAVVAALGPALGVREHRAWAADNQDAFDAAVAAIALWEGRARLAALPVEADPRRRLEGRIWRP